MRNSFIANLAALQLPQDIIDQAVRCFDAAAAGYDIRPKSTDLIVSEDLPEMVKTFIAVKAVEGCSKTTLYNYKLALENFFRPIGGAPVEQITANMIRGYLHLYRSERGVELRSLNSVRQIICGFFSWATDEGYLERNPARSIKPIRCAVPFA